MPIYSNPIVKKDSMTYHYDDESFEIAVTTEQILNVQAVTLTMNPCYKLLRKGEVREILLLSPSGRCALFKPNDSAKTSYDPFENYFYLYNGNAAAFKLNCSLYKTFPDIDALFVYISTNNIPTSLWAHRNTINKARGVIYYW